MQPVGGQCRRRLAGGQGGWSSAVMGDAAELMPAEAMILMDTSVNPSQLSRVTIMALMLRRVVRAATEQRHGLFRSRQAAMIAASLGTLILLAPELRPRLKQVAKMLQEPDAGVSGDSGSDLHGSERHGLDAGGDAGFYAFGGAMDEFDASFDAAFDGGGGDGGGDSGGSSAGAWGLTWAAALPTCQAQPLPMEPLCSPHPCSSPSPWAACDYATAW